MRNLENAPVCFWHWDWKYTVAAVVLSFFLGAALANGYATHQALQRQWWDCKWVIGEQLRAQRNKLEDQ